MRSLYLIAVWFHILAAIVWIGGIIFLSLVLVPVTRRPECLKIASSLFQWTGERFRTVSWICLVILVITGSFVLHYRGLDSADFWRDVLSQGAYGWAVVVKLISVVVILLLSAYHDFIIGPRAMVLWHADPSSPAARRLRRQAGWLGRINLLLALVVAAMGIIVVRGWL